ncbi:hypothetical protein TetV_291 [Tetraselmis virus 1]|uniref:Uncharacterized protein n=1 Tax=Tetraselmis virus 1 TaxID=2060617 RepID=A0A2P0VNC4_9VIRU|nr:hypothetical protein QJ968_gp291 [Tetraselmis virus 1]AUF82383.1 hypothetical protein TetV_291 [Tetraselmis virus 1]
MAASLCKNLIRCSSIVAGVIAFVIFFYVIIDYSRSQSEESFQQEPRYLTYDDHTYGLPLKFTDRTCNPKDPNAKCPGGFPCSANGICPMPCDKNGKCPPGFQAVTNDQGCFCFPSCDDGFGRKEGEIECTIIPVEKCHLYPGYTKVCDQKSGECQCVKCLDDTCECPDGQVIQFDGSCGPCGDVQCPSGMECDEGKCVTPTTPPFPGCSSDSAICVDQQGVEYCCSCDTQDGKCPDGTSCIDGLCCEPGKTVVTKPDGSKECSDCGPDTECPNGQTCISGKCTDNDNIEDGDPSAPGCAAAWPSPVSGSIINGYKMALYENVEPCLYLEIFKDSMNHRLDFKQALEKCSNNPQCDGIFICESGSYAKGFKFKFPNGKNSNPVRISEGDAVILKGCPGDCGTKGKPKQLGNCSDIAGIANFVEKTNSSYYTIKEHRICNSTPLRFLSTGLVSDNFPSGTDKMVIRDPMMDAKVCTSICQNDIRCDGVVFSDNTCQMFSLPEDLAPTLRPSKGTRTIFMGKNILENSTRTDVLKSAADPADHVLTPMKNVVYIRDLSMKVWCQFDNEKRSEVAVNDGLAPAKRYCLTLEGAEADGDKMLTVNWVESMVDNVEIKRSGNSVNGYLKAKFFLKVTFTAKKMAHVQEMIWFEDEMGRRTRPHSHGEGLSGTYVDLQSGGLSLTINKKPSAKNWSYGQIVMTGEILNSDRKTSLPDESQLLESLKLKGIQVSNKGSSYQWEPISRDTIEVTWMKSNDIVIDKLGFPSLGSHSVIAVYAGNNIGDLALVARICSSGMEHAPTPPPVPRGYQTWINSPSHELVTVGEEPSQGSYECADACRNFNSDGNDGIGCNAFTMDENTCMLHAWTPNKRENSVWGGEGSQVVYHLGEKPVVKSQSNM